MITIEMTNTFRYTNPMVLADPANYIIELGQAGEVYPSPSNQIYANDISSGQERGGPGRCVVRPDEPFVLTEEQFSLMAQSGKQGGDTNFISILLYLVSTQTLVVKDDGVVLTATQILNYTA